MKRLLLLFVATLAAAPAHSNDTDHALTIYSRAQPGAVDPSLYRPGGQYQSGSVPGYAVVRQTTSKKLEEGVSTLRVQNVASLIDPTTVSMRPVREGGGIRVLEQNYEFDLVSSAKLLNRYLDRAITVTRRVGDGMEDVSGTLLSTDGGLVLRRADGEVLIITDYEDIKLPELPGGLITRPTLVWSVQSDRAGPRELRITYQTEGMTWWADYNATLDEGPDRNAGCSMDINAWVSIVNQSGAGFPDTRLKLIAGDVQRVSGPQPRAKMEMALAARPEADGGFQEKSFFEYHLYTLPRRTSLPDNSTKQLELFPAAIGVPCTKEYVYDGRGYYPGYHSNPVLDRNIGNGPDDVSVFLSFRNDEQSGLGMPLPAGRLRINKLDAADDSLEFIGEDVIDHTPRDEDLRVRLGNAFDVVAERRQTDYRVDTSSKTLRESFEIEIRNHKQTPVTVKINEVLYRWVNWEIIESTHEFDKLDARSIQFSVPVEADGKTTLRYEVRYSW